MEVSKCKETLHTIRLRMIEEMPVDMKAETKSAGRKTLTYCKWVRSSVRTRSRSHTTMPTIRVRRPVQDSDLRINKGISMLKQ